MAGKEVQKKLLEAVLTTLEESHEKVLKMIASVEAAKTSDTAADLKRLELLALQEDVVAQLEAGKKSKTNVKNWLESMGAPFV